MYFIQLQDNTHVLVPHPQILKNPLSSIINFSVFNGLLILYKYNYIIRNLHMWLQTGYPFSPTRCGIGHPEGRKALQEPSVVMRCIRGALGVTGGHRDAYFQVVKLTAVVELKGYPVVANSIYQKYDLITLFITRRSSPSSHIFFSNDTRISSFK